MHVSMQMRELANAVGEDFAMNAPDDTAKLVGRARRGRMVWSTGVGVAVVGSAASLAFGGPALASALSSGPAVAPAASDSATPSATATASPSPEASVASSVTPSAPPATFRPLPGAGTIDLTGGAGVGGGDDDSYGDDSSDDHSGGDSVDGQSKEHESDSESD